MVTEVRLMFPLLQVVILYGHKFYNVENSGEISSFCDESRLLQFLIIIGSEAKL